MKFALSTLRFASAAILAAIATGALAQKGETVKIAMIEGLSGPFANVGQNQLKSWQLVTEKLSGARNAAGVKFEVVGMDSKSSPQEALNLLKAASDQGFRYVTQGNGSNVAVPLADAVAKHNERNPGKEIVYLNYAAVDPVLTNEKCSYSHFRLDADTSMKMAALTSFMKDQPKISKVYLINQNYSHGQQVSKYFKEGLARNRPDAKIVGDDLHPLGQVKDFAPYVAKIRQSGADTIVTGNWGQDMTLLIKALNDPDLRLLRGRVRHPHGARVGRRPRGLPDRLQPLELHRRARHAHERVQGEVQRRLLHLLDLQRDRDAGRRHGQGQVDRPHEGRRVAGRAEVQGLQRRIRDAQDRPPAAAGPLDLQVAEGRRQVQVQRGEHGLHLRAREVPRALHRQHADVVRDEASGALSQAPPAKRRRVMQVAPRRFF
jgi:hypothetical protein